MLQLLALSFELRSMHLLSLEDQLEAAVELAVAVEAVDSDFDSVVVDSCSDMALDGHDSLVGPFKKSKKR